MKKALILILLFPLISYSQLYISEDFEDYNYGDSISVVSPNFSLWSGNEIEDVLVDNVQSNSGSNSLYLESLDDLPIPGGPQDIVLEFGELLDDGELTISTSFFIPSGKGAYFNLQGDTTIGNIWTTDFTFNSDGTLNLTSIEEDDFEFNFPFCEII